MAALRRAPHGAVRLIHFIPGGCAMRNSVITGMRRGALVAISLALFALLWAPASSHAEEGEDKSAAVGQEQAPAADAVIVVLETTKGDIVLEVHPEWSPKGVEHFLELVDAKFYDGAPWFRVIDGFVAQCGIAADPKLNGEWSEQTIPDEPVVQGNEPGYIAFGQSAAPDSRSTHIFINFGNNSKSLDPQGFACFAKVIAGLDVALKLHKCEWSDQDGLARKGGLAAFAARYPEADYITRAYVEQAEPEEPEAKEQ
jgi:peptidyl-prolyl cis-trans isomerase A (cyclophilin A)